MPTAVLWQKYAASTSNSSTANINAAASFTGTGESTLGFSGIMVNFMADRPCEIQVQQSSNDTNYDIVDTWVLDGYQFEGKVIKAVASYFKVAVRNIGISATTAVRLQTLLCAVADATARAPSANNKLPLATVGRSYLPDPSNGIDQTVNRALAMDADRSLNVRAGCMTDESSFRDDFPGSNPYTDLTGTVYFTTSRTEVVGSGTAFLSEVTTQDYIKLSGHADSVYAAVSEVISDTLLILDAAYGGATANGTGRISKWLYATGSGSTIAVSSSELTLATGTTSGADTYARRVGDYPPYVAQAKCRITQRIANQQAQVGFADGIIGALGSQAMFVFDGTTNTTVKTRTSCAAGAAGETEENTVTLPGAVVTSTAAVYRVEIQPARVNFFINDIKVAEHRTHIPAPYDLLDLWINIKNTGTAGSTTTLAADYFFFSNFNQIQVADHMKGDPLPVKELRTGTATCSNVSAAASDTSLLAANANRVWASIFNDSASVVYVKLGTGASSSSFTVTLMRGDYWEVPPCYTGPVNGYWQAATGSARLTEIS